jgi:hypothetical protein
LAENVGMLSAMAREFVERNGIGETVGGDIPTMPRRRLIATSAAGTGLAASVLAFGQTRMTTCFKTATHR